MSQKSSSILTTYFRSENNIHFKSFQTSFISILFILFFSNTSFAQDTLAVNSDTLGTKVENAALRKEAPNLFFDCDFCNQQFYRQELNFVNFVRDRRLADIYLMVTLNRTGSGGNQYNLYFVGENKFKGQYDTLRVETLPNQADAELREAILRAMKKGLLKYLVQTKLLEKISYSIETPAESMDAGKIKDKWNFWTVNLNAELFGDANSYAKSINMNYSGAANRTTEKLKTETGGWYNLNQQEFKIDDTTTIKGFQNNTGAYHLLAFSIGKHFAVGQSATFFKSTQDNLNHSISYYPTFEYNVFPYSIATRKQFRFIYRIGVRNQDYTQTTIYGRKNEWYAPHSIVIQYSQIEKWGRIDISAGGWHYLNRDYTKNYSLSIYPSINFNPFKGMRIGLWGGFKIVNDQFFLKASEASASDILLNQVSLKTDYNYNFGFNIGYTFGSAFNNIVNVRFNFNDNYW